MDNAGIKGNLPVAQSAGVSGAIVIFVMESDHGEIRLKGTDALEDANADPGVFLDRAEFVVGERAILEEHGIGNTDFSDVMEEGTDAETLER